MPSPILPDGTLLSLPIPSKNDMEHYTDIRYGKDSYFDIIKSLKPRTHIKAKYTCHLDPDIRRNIKERPKSWLPAFGQRDAALGHLRNQGVDIGDIFLFFGWFRQTEYHEGKLRFVPNAPDLHIIYGYLQIGNIISSTENTPSWLCDHPHAASLYWDENKNAIFIASETLSLEKSLPGAGCLHFADNLVLTKDGCSRSIWNLPKFFKNIPISYNRNSWKDDGFHSAAKGQEFVFEATNEALAWIRSLLSTKIWSKI